MSIEFSELGSVAEFINGAAFRPDDWSDEGRRIIRIQNLTDPEKPFNRTKREVPARLLVEPGDLLVSWSASLGVFEWKEDDVAVLNQHIFRVIPDEQKIDKRYLRYALDRALSQMQRHLHGATMQHVNRGQFLSTKLFTPSITEQRRIANILDSVDVLRAKRRDALAQLGTLTQSMFFDMFGDPATNPKAWPEVSLGEVITNGPQNGLYKPSSSYGSGTPILRIDAFYDGEVTNLRSLKRVEISAPERERYGLQNGNIVINRVNSREYLGKSALIRDLKEATVFESNIMRFNVNARLLAPDYLISLLQTQHVYAQIQRRAKDAVNQSSINQYDVKAMQLVVPPLWLQETFVLRKLAAAKHAQALQLSLSGVDALFASLQHRAFRGEL